MEIELITENQMKALSIIKFYGEVQAVDFAKAMWSESKMMNHADYKLNRNGLSYLFKLVKRGFIKNENYIFSLTEKGEIHLNERDF